MSKSAPVLASGAGGRSRQGSGAVGERMRWDGMVELWNGGMVEWWNGWRQQLGHGENPAAAPGDNRRPNLGHLFLAQLDRMAVNACGNLPRRQSSSRRDPRGRRR